MLYRLGLTLLRENQEYFLNLPVGHVITILLDHGYHAEALTQEVKKIDPQLAARIKIELAKKVTPEQRRAAKAENQAKKGLVVIKQWWIVERTNAWINQCRVLWKNCESILRTSEMKLRSCAIRLMLRRLA